MPNMSGNFDTYSEEKSAVRYYFSLMGYSPFAVNSKNSNQVSHRDTWQSATIFVNPSQVEKYKITPDTFDNINHFTSLAT